jgi:predicted enzyme related to lactoylglutathione lyase
MKIMMACVLGLFPLLIFMGCKTDTTERAAALPDLSIQANLVFFYYPDLGAAERFYTEVLGIEKVLDYGFAKICRISQSTYIGLVDADRGMHSPDEPKTVTLSFVTDEIDQWYAYLVAQGLEIKGTLHDATRHPTRGFVTYDPAGYFLEFERFLDHPQNAKLHERLKDIVSLYPVPDQNTTRPEGLGIRANVIWLYYRDVPAAQRFYEDVFGSALLVDQGFAKVYGSSGSGFIGLVDEAQGLHRFSEAKAVNVAFLTDEIDAWYGRFKEHGLDIKDPLEDATSIPVRAFVAYDTGGYFLEFDRFLQDPRNDRILGYLK